jgi:hypothetical protein
MSGESKGSLRWRRRSDYCIQSDCGAFTVVKIGEKFEWWHGKEQGDLLDTADEAREACEVKHSELQPTADSS